MIWDLLQISSLIVELLIVIVEFINWGKICTMSTLPCQQFSSLEFSAALYIHM